MNLIFFFVNLQYYQSKLSENIRQQNNNTNKLQV